MTGPLRLSHNELSALLKYVFQGLFGHAQDWGALAERVLWLETHGFNGVSKLVDAINADVLRKFDGIIAQTENGLHVDFAGNSVLMGLPLLVDLAVAHSVKQKAFDIAVTNTVHGEALVNVVAALRARDINATFDLTTMIISLNTDSKKNSILDIDQATQYYAQSLRDGIPLDAKTYAFLNKIADKTLVAATEASRRGAGE